MEVIIKYIKSVISLSSKHHHFHHQQTPLVTRSAGAKTLLDKWRDLCGL
jgi:hypothetical protein